MNNRYPRISLVTPSFNQAQFIEETIDAILSQGYPKLEYIIVDGGSTDGTIEIIKRHESHLAWWISADDEGQSDAINKGFARSTGEVITFCNSDDFYFPGTLSDVAEAFREYPKSGVIVGGIQYVDKETQPVGDTHEPSLKVTAPYDLTLGPPGVYRLHQAAAFFTRQALDTVGRYVREDLTYTMDRELLYRVVRQFPVTLRQRTYAAFRLHQDSKSVAHILPFAEEFSRLYLMHLSDDEQADRRRRVMARHHRAKGYLKYAKATDGKIRSMRALLNALVYRPSFLFNKGYYAHWARFAGLR